MKRIAFIGHRNIFNSKLENKLFQVVENEILNGYKNFLLGNHGEFDLLALKTLRKLKKTYSDIKIEIVVCNIPSAKSKEYLPNDVNFILYDVENVHYKSKITMSNRFMIDDCDKLICYVNENYSNSGAKTALKYAQKQNKEIINLIQFSS